MRDDAPTKKYQNAHYMKKKFLFYSFITVVLACNNKTNNNERASDSTSEKPNSGISFTDSSKSNYNVDELETFIYVLNCFLR